MKVANGERRGLGCWRCVVGRVVCKKRRQLYRPVSMHQLVLNPHTFLKTLNVDIVNQFIKLKRKGVGKLNVKTNPVTQKCTKWKVNPPHLASSLLSLSYSAEIVNDPLVVRCLVYMSYFKLYKTFHFLV